MTARERRMRGNEIVREIECVSERRKVLKGLEKDRKKGRESKRERRKVRAK